MVKKLLIGIGVLGILFAIAFGVLLWNLNPIVESFRPQVVSKISETLGQPISVEKLDVQLIPRVALSVHDVAIADNEDTSLSVERMLLRTSLRDLMAGKISVQKIELAGATVGIQRTAEGKLIVAGIPLGQEKQETKAKPAKSAATASGSPETTDASQRPSTLDLKIESIVLDDINVIFTDRHVTPNATITLSRLGGTISDITLEPSAQIDLSAKLLSDTSENLSIRGQISASGQDLPNMALKLDLKHIDLTQLSSLISSYAALPEGLELGNTLSVALSTEPTATGGLKFNFQAVATQAKIAFADFFVKEAGKKLEITSSGEIDPKKSNQLKADSLLIRLGGIEVNTPLVVTPGVELGAKIEANSLSLAEIAEVSPVFASFNPAGVVKADLRYRQDLAKNPKPPTANGKLELNDVRVGPPAKDKKALVVSKLTGPIALAGDEIKVGGISGLIDAEPFSLSAAINRTDTQITLKEAVLSIFNGSLKLAGKLVDQNLSAQVEASNLNLANASGFFLADKPLTITGNLESLKFFNTLNLKDPVKTVKGQLEATIRQGSIKGVNIIGGAVKKVEAIPGLPNTLESAIPEEHRSILEGDETAFDSLRIRTNFSDSKGQLNELALQHLLYIVSGSGGYNFDGDFKINTQLRLTPTISEPMVARQPRVKLLLDNQNNLTIPTVVQKKGTRTTVLPDSSELAKNAARRTAGEAAGRALDRVAPNIGGGARKALESLF